MLYNESFIQAKEKLAVRNRGEQHERKEGRLPSGQILTERFPVLDLGVQPAFDPKTWGLHVYGLIEKERVYTYQDILQMPITSLAADFHCVTKWSKFDVKWKGVLFRDFVKIVKPRENWKYLVQEGMDGYTTNVARGDLERENVLLAYELEGKPLPKEHGGPLRMIIPHLYAWKGSKFLNGVKFLEEDQQGFWELRGYHNRGDAFKEERYG